MKRKLFYLAAGAFAAALAMEAALRLLPVSTGLNAVPVNAENPVRTGLPNFRYAYSHGWSMRLVNRGVLNDHGFMSDQQYAAAKPNALLIGDSYVVAQAIPQDKNLHSVLSNTAGIGKVYGLGVLGTAISDYLAMAKWGVERYQPKALVFLLVSTDVTDSVLPKAGGHYFKEEDGSFRLERRDRPPLSKPVELANRTMLFRYFFDNLKFADRFRLGAGIGKPVAASGTAMGPEDASKIREISEFFLAELSRVFPEKQIVFVIRNNGVNRTMTEPAPLRDIDILGSVAVEKGFAVVDLSPAFGEFELQNNRRLSFSPVDSHWNEAAQQLAAKEIAPVLAQMLR